MQTIQEIFPGIMIYDQAPVEVQNPFSGESYTLTPEEVSVYDYLKGCELVRDYTGMRRALDWFIDNNPEAYSVSVWVSVWVSASVLVWVSVLVRVSVWVSVSVSVWVSVLVLV